MNNKENEEVTIDLSELFHILGSRLPVILLSGIVLAMAAFLVTVVFMTPLYTSETKIYVLSRQDQQGNVTYSDLQMGSQLTKDYMELVKTKPVLSQVITETGLDETTEELAKRIEVSTPPDTRILSIKVSDENPKKAKEVTNALRKAVSVQITDIMDAKSVNTVEEASLPTKPSSPNKKKNTLVGMLLGILIAIACIVIKYVSDDTIKTPEDVEKYLDLSVLAVLPVKDGKKSGRKRR